MDPLVWHSLAPAEASVVPMGAWRVVRHPDVQRRWAAEPYTLDAHSTDTCSYPLIPFELVDWSPAVSLSFPPGISALGFYLQNIKHTLAHFGKQITFHTYQLTRTRPPAENRQKYHCMPDFGRLHDSSKVHTHCRLWLRHPYAS